MSEDREIFDNTGKKQMFAEARKLNAQSQEPSNVHGELVREVKFLLDRMERHGDNMISAASRDRLKAALSSTTGIEVSRECAEYCKDQLSAAIQQDHLQARKAGKTYRRKMHKELEKALEISK